MDAAKVRHKRDPGRCYLKAGFRRPPCPHCGGYAAGKRCEVCEDGKARTKGGLLVFQMLEADMPAAESAVGSQASMFAVV